MDTTSLATSATPETIAETVPVQVPTLASNGMDFFFTEVPEQLLGATELDVQLSPLLQDRIAQLCLVKMRQASSGRESLERLARLSCFWRRLQTEMLLMPSFSAPQVPAPLEQWLTEFAALEPSAPVLQGSNDFNLGLDFLMPSPGGLGLDFDIWNIDSTPQNLATDAAFTFPFSLQTPASGFLEFSSIPPFPSSVKPPSMEQMQPEAIIDTSSIASQQQGTDIMQTESPVDPFAASSLSSISSVEVPQDLQPMGDTTASEANADHQALQVTDYATLDSGMDVDLPIQDMALTSPPSSPRKRRASNTTRRSAGSQRRGRKTIKTIRQRRTKNDTASFAIKYASATDAMGDIEEDVGHASRIKRRRGSEDSSSSDSSPESAPSSPRTPPSTYDGSNVSSAATDLSPPSQPLYQLSSQLCNNKVNSICSSAKSDCKGTMSPTAGQDLSLGNKTSHLATAIVVEGLVNLKHMEDGDDAGGLSAVSATRISSHRPSTRPFGHS